MNLPRLTRDCSVSGAASPFPPYQSSKQTPIWSFRAGSVLKWPASASPATVSFKDGGFGRRCEVKAMSAAVGDSPAKALRRILQKPGVHQGPACFDALSAKLVERAGFEYCFTSGFSMSAARLGLPDVGYISYGEVLDQGFQITQAVSIPVIGDGDNGYGNAMNVKRTVKGFIKAGFAGIILEDQVSPKACGHTRGRKVVSREEAIMRIEAAIDARTESGSDIVIIARSDARQAVSLDEALWRARAFADAGADVLFIDALASRGEMQALCKISPLLPKMANMLEGGGKTPILNPVELEEIGFKLVSYPLSLIGVSIRAMEDALIAIKGGRLSPPGALPSFEEIKEKLGFNSYYEEELRYSTISGQTSDLSGHGHDSAQSLDQVTEEQSDNNSGGPIVEVITPYVHENKYESNDAKRPFSGIWSRSLRVKITGRDGLEKLDIRVPAGFLDGLTNIVQGVGGVNLKQLLDNIDEDVESNAQQGMKVIDFVSAAGDRIQVFLE